MRGIEKTRLMRHSQALRWLGVFAFLLLTVGGLNACEPATGPTPLPTETSPTSATPVPPTPDVITLTEAQHQQTISVSVGKVINLRGFAEGNWTLSYNATFLELLTAPEIVSQPGPDGWFFQALAPGETVILLESVPPPCPTEPCMPNIQRFEFPLQVVP